MTRHSLASPVLQLYEGEKKETEQHTHAPPVSSLIINIQKGR